jgi:hypothetical protein
MSSYMLKILLTVFSENLPMRLRDYNYYKILISTICKIMALTLSEWYSILPW